MKDRQRTARFEGDCTECSKYIAQDDPVFYLDGNIHCVTCAVRKKIECPVCHGSKKPDFAVCYQCYQEGRTVLKKAVLS